MFKMITFTERQQEVLQTLWDCNADKSEVADKLCITLNTLRCYLNMFFDEFRVHSLSALMVVVAKKGFVSVNGDDI